MKLFTLISDPSIYTSASSFPTSLPKGYELVFASLSFSIIMNAFLQMLVLRARKKYGISPPTLYATSDQINDKGKCKSMDDVNKYSN